MTRNQSVAGVKVLDKSNGKGFNPEMFAHEKLRVYAKALQFVAETSGLSAGWSSRHSIVDQLERASESLIFNLADGARFRSTPGKLKALDYALGSGLECAACLDVARIKGLLNVTETKRQKRELLEVINMLVGLRKVWESWKAHEDPVPYEAESSCLNQEHSFHHENLDVYCVALELMAWFVGVAASNEVSSRAYRQIDEGVTSVILNIAEGNGRYSELDHRRFLDIAEGSTVKVAAYLDLLAQKRVLSEKHVEPGKALLERILAMLSRM